MTVVFGFDPGKSGGMAMLNGDQVEIAPMPIAGGPIDWYAVARWVDHLMPMDADAIAYVEKVHSMPKQGVRSMFSFGTAYGGILGVLGALSIPTVLVTPQQWKGAVLRGTKKDKAAAIEYCRMRWPTVSLLATERSRTPHDGMTDALCIAEYGRTAGLIE